MGGIDIRFVVLAVDSIIVLALLMTLIVRLLNKALTNSTPPAPGTPEGGPKTIDQMNIDIPL